jgi:hypothetical protein
VTDTHSLSPGSIMLLAATHQAALTKNVVNQALRARQLLRKVAAIRSSENPLPGETAALEALDHIDPGHRFTTALATSHGDGEGGRRTGIERGGLQRWVKTTLVKWKAEGVRRAGRTAEGKAKDKETSKVHDGDVVSAMPPSLQFRQVPEEQRRIFRLSPRPYTPTSPPRVPRRLSHLRRLLVTMHRCRRNSQCPSARGPVLPPWPEHPRRR